jgi:hypothetical protein
MSLSDEYNEALRNRQDAEQAAVNERAEQEHQREIGLALAQRLDEDVIGPFVRSADCSAGHSASKLHSLGGWIAKPDPMIPKSYEQDRKVGPPWRRQTRLERKPARSWVVRTASGGELVLYEHGWWKYATYEHEYDGPTRVTFSIGRWRDEDNPEHSKLYSSAVKNGDWLFGHLKQAVATFMVEHGIEFHG